MYFIHLSLINIRNLSRVNFRTCLQYFAGVVLSELVGALSFQDRQQRFQEDLHVELNRNIVDIGQIIFQLLAHVVK